MSGKLPSKLQAPDTIGPVENYLQAYQLLKPMTKNSMTMDPSIQQVVGSAENLEDLLQRLADFYRNQAVQYTFDPGEQEFAEYHEIESAIEARKALKAIAAAMEILQSEDEEDLGVLPKVAATRDS